MHAMRLILITLVILSVCSANIQRIPSNIEKVDGGIGLNLRNSLLDHIKSELLGQIFAKLLTISIPDQHISQDLLGLITVNGSLTDIDLEYIGIDLDNSDLKFQEDSPNILVDLTNVGLVLNFNYSLVADPSVYEDVGEAVINVAPFNLTFGMTIEVEEGMLQTKIIGFGYQFDDYTINFTGGGDVSFLLVTLATTFKDLLKEDFSPNILALLEALVEPAINDLLTSFGTQQEIMDLVVDYEFMNYSPFADGDLSLVLKGEVRPKDESSLPFVDDRRVPAHSDPQGGDIQAFVSDYVIHSLLYSVYKTNLLSLIVTDNPLSPGKPLKVSDITLLFPDLTKKFDKSTPVYFEVSSTEDFDPLFKIENGETYLTLRLDLTMGAIADSSDVILFTLLSEANMTLNYGLEDGIKIAASISSFKFKVLNIVVDNVGLDESDINALFGLVTGVVRNYVNYALDAIDIPIPEIPMIDIDLNKTFIYEKNGYLTFDCTPRFIIKAKRLKYTPLQIDRSMTVKNQYSSYDSKVEIFKRLIKVTPLMGLLNEVKQQKRFMIVPHEFIGGPIEYLDETKDHCSSPGSESCSKKFIS